MNRFPHPLRVELLADRVTWRLLAPFSYIDPDHGPVTVPEGFETDLASVRPVRTLGAVLLLAGWLLMLWLPSLGGALVALGVAALLLYAAVVGYAQEPAAVHDWLYRTGHLPRRPADRVFLNAMRSRAVARWRAWPMWAVVRACGAYRYRKNNRRV